MRELTKSMLSFSWAMPLYGMKQMLNLTLPRDMSRPFGEATDGFNSVTGAMREQLGSTMRSMFDAGDQIQRSMVDVMFSLGFGAFDPNTWMRSGQSMGQGTRQMQGTGGSSWGAPGSTSSGAGPTSTGGQQPAGWGPVPAPAGGSTGSYGSGTTDYGNRAADAGARAAEYGARSMEQGARAVTEAASATAAAFGGQSSGSGRSHRNR